MSNFIVNADDEACFDFNEQKLSVVRRKIEECRAFGKEFRIIFLDIDNVINNSEPTMQRQLEKINYLASSAYRRSVMGRNSEDKDRIAMKIKKSYDILDGILEETMPLTERMDYEEIHQDKNLFRQSIPWVNEMLEDTSYKEKLVYELGDNHEVEFFFLYLTHINPPREAATKIRKYFYRTPLIDGVIWLPFHDNHKHINSKALYATSILGLHPREFKNCYLIDDTEKNIGEWKSYGGLAIPFLTSGFPDPRELDPDECEKYSEHNCERMLIDMNPSKIADIIGMIEQDRNIGLDTVNIQQKVKRMVIKR